MQTAAVHFKRNILHALRDSSLQESIAGARDKFVEQRAAAVAQYRRYGDFEALRERGKTVRDLGIRRMPELLRQFERNAERRGVKVLWAADGDSACRQIVRLARRHGASLAVKSKSMAAEEIRLSPALSAAGIETVETDLGEFIISLAGEPPSHIIAPAVHLRRRQIAALFRRHGIPLPDEDIVSLTRAARRFLRRKFLRADIGISGANFLLADAGAALMVTNEGNGRLTATLPRVHITLAGIDKIVPSMADIPDLLALLTRSATGQTVSNYVSLIAGGKNDSESGSVDISGQTAEGGARYVVLLDNGRSRIRRGVYRDMLRCIRCGACMNHCPVYQAVGGHAYGSTYMGPMGQVLTPLLAGLRQSVDLPHAATMCGACAVVCPVKIPLPDLMRKLREQQVAENLRPRGERIMLAAWARAAKHPRLYAIAAAVIVRFLAVLGGEKKIIRSLPVAKAWFRGRYLTAPPGRTFRAMRKELDL